MKSIATLTAFLLFSLTAFAQTTSSSGTCSLATLHSSYGFSISGTRPTPTGSFESIVGTANTTFDGAGGFTQIDNVHGSAGDYVSNRSGSGTYTLNPDCTGTMTLTNEGAPFSLVLSIVVVDNGKEIRTAVVDVSPRPMGVIPPIMVQSNGKRI